MLDEFGFFFFQVKQVHGLCAGTTRSCILPNKQTIIKKNIRIPEKKTKWRSIRKGTSTDFSFRICVDFFKKMQEFYHVVRMEGFLYVAGRDVGDKVPVCTIKKKTHNTFSSTRCFIEYLVANEIIDQYRYA